MLFRSGVVGLKSDLDVRLLTTQSPERIRPIAEALLYPLWDAGVSIGHHCVVGAGSLVNDDLPPYSIAVGTPARVRGHVAVDDAVGRATLHWDP